MSNAPQRFLEVLLIELKDLEVDIGVMMEKYRQDHDREAITNYVFFENVALMQRELFGIEGICKDLRELDVSAFPSVQALRDHINSTIQQRCTQRSIPGAVSELVKRKLDKVQKYTE